MHNKYHHNYVGKTIKHKRLCLTHFADEIEDLLEQLGVDDLLHTVMAQVELHDSHYELDDELKLEGKIVVTVDPAYTSKNDYRGLERGVRRGCRYYASDGNIYDADWNASINIARRYSQRKEVKGVKLPVSFSMPIDGRLNLMGKPHQLANCEIRSRKPNDL